LFAAGVQNRPDALVPLSAHHRATALRDTPINDQLTNALLAAVIGRWYSRIKQESEDCLTMFTQPLGQRRRLARLKLLPFQKNNAQSSCNASDGIGHFLKFC